jgi:hypothetical protein
MLRLERKTVERRRPPALCDTIFPRLAEPTSVEFVIRRPPLPVLQRARAPLPTSCCSVQSSAPSPVASIIHRLCRPVLSIRRPSHRLRLGAHGAAAVPPRHGHSASAGRATGAAPELHRCYCKFLRAGAPSPSRAGTCNSLPKHHAAPLLP